MTDFIGARLYERSETLNGLRSSFKPQQLTTRVGSLALVLTQDTGGNSRSELLTDISGMRRLWSWLCKQGFYGQAFSSSSVYRLSAEIDAWFSLPLTKEYSLLIINTRYEKIRHNGGLVAQVDLMVVGVSVVGCREILTVAVASAETDTRRV